MQLYVVSIRQRGLMGIYTTNYNLFMPSVGETGWGDLVNGNFSTIDTTMKSLSNRITAVENEVNGALNCTSVTTSGNITSGGTITSAGNINANGGITTPILNLPVATSGNFAIGKISSNTISIPVSSRNLPSGASFTITTSPDSLIVSSTLPSVFNVSGPTTNYDCTLGFSDDLYGWRIDVYQNDVLVGTAAGRGATSVACNEITLTDELTIIVTNTHTDYNGWSRNFTLAIKQITYYLV